MCTSILYSPKDHYFGRNLDYEIAYGQKVVITPRNYEFEFTDLPAEKSHYAMIGVAAVQTILHYIAMQLMKKDWELLV